MNPGDKVVCVTSNVDGYVLPTLSEFNKTYILVGDNLVVNKIYVITKIVPHVKGMVGICLINSSIICNATGIEVGWDMRLFRKLDDMKKEAQERQSQVQSQQKEQDAPLQSV